MYQGGCCNGIFLIMPPNRPWQIKGSRNYVTRSNHLFIMRNLRLERGSGLVTGHPVVDWHIGFLIPGLAHFPLNHRNFPVLNPVSCLHLKWSESYLLNPCPFVRKDIHQFRPLPWEFSKVNRGTMMDHQKPQRGQKYVASQIRVERECPSLEKGRLQRL